LFYLLPENGPLPPKIVLMGMSCVGKSTFAQILAKDQGYAYHSFDVQYNYKRNTLPGVSKQKQWKTILSYCVEDQWVLDNWSTEDFLGTTLYEAQPHACIVVLYDKYVNILERYRVPVRGEDAHKMMFVKMYIQTPFADYRSVRFLKVVDDGYREMTYKEFTEEPLPTTHPDLVFKDWIWRG
jgi:hypothetical protein